MFVRNFAAVSEYALSEEACLSATHMERTEEKKCEIARPKAMTN